MNATSDARDAGPVLPNRALHPKIRLVWQINASVLALVVFVPSLVTLIAVDAPYVFAILIAVSLGGAALTLPAVRYSHFRYEIRERDLSVSKGVLFHRLILVPFDRIQFVETKQGPLDRALSVTQLVVHTAGGHVGIPGLERDAAERVREELSRVAGSLSV